MAAETRSEPRQPIRLLKKKNIVLASVASGVGEARRGRAPEGAGHACETGRMGPAPEGYADVREEPR